jgi:hypothetical protein
MPSLVAREPQAGSVLCSALGSVFLSGLAGESPPLRTLLARCWPTAPPRTSRRRLRQRRPRRTTTRHTSGGVSKDSRRRRSPKPPWARPPRRRHASQRGARTTGPHSAPQVATSQGRRGRGKRAGGEVVPCCGGDRWLYRRTCGGAESAEGAQCGVRPDPPPAASQAPLPPRRRFLATAPRPMTTRPTTSISVTSSMSMTSSTIPTTSGPWQASACHRPDPVGYARCARRAR